MPKLRRLKLLGPLGVAGIRPGPADAPPSLDQATGVRFYRRVLSYFREDRRLITLLIALIWLALAAGILEGAVVAVLADAVLSERAPDSPPARWLLTCLDPHATRATRIVQLAVGWFLFRAIVDLAQLLRDIINARLKFNGTARVRQELFDHLQTLSPAYHKSRPQGDAIYRLSTDALGFFGVLDTFIGAANSILTLIVVGIVMSTFNFTITAVCLALTPLLIVANIYFSRTIRRTSALSKQVDTDLTTFVQRAMSTVALAQLFGRQRTESARFGSTVDRTIVAGMSMSWQQQLFPWAQRLVYSVGHAFVLGYGGWLVFRGQETGVPNALTVGGVFAMTVYLGQLWEPIRRMAGFTAEVQNNVAACIRVFTILDLEPTVKDEPAAKPLAVRPRVLELKEVAFSYSDNRPVLQGITAKIDAGQMVAFVGPSGTGKSTLLNLLPRFYDPVSGSVTLDGQDLRDIRLNDVRKHVALVPQESPVIAGAIADNIAFGKPDATPEQIAQAAELAGAAEFIAELPAGYQTEVTEAGQNLSGGQRQRLAIARALLTEAPILILDEPTSGLDRHHERLVLETLHRLKGRRTIVLITHNLEAVTECDQIFFLSAGRIVEAGTHEQLLARRGLYAAMAASGISTTDVEAMAFDVDVVEMDVASPLQRSETAFLP